MVDLAFDSVCALARKGPNQPDFLQRKWLVSVWLYVRNCNVNLFVDRKPMVPSQTPPTVADHHPTIEGT